MYKRWIGTLALVLLFIHASAQPSLAGLTEACFKPLMQARNVLAGNPVQYQYHIVERGDTLWDIAHKYHVPIESLMKMNGLNSRTVLEVGDRLKLPMETANVHVIARGETLWGIANEHDISVTALCTANPGVRPYSLKIGQRLVIPGRHSTGTIQVASASNRSLSRPGMMLWPLLGSITSAYGWRSSGFHHGLDIAGDIGDPIRAAAGGKVCFAGTKAVYGRTIIIEHGDGSRTVYAHLQKIRVAENQTVERGQVIGTVGMSGRTTGPHLHFEVRKDDKTYNPVQYLSR